MSGIAGLFYLDGRPVEQTLLERMTDILAHRGPDDAGIWHNGPVGLGHRMLWTTPESLHEKLPLTNVTGELVITADARIDNRAELLPLLGFNDRPAADVADSQLILAAYEKWGEQCPEKLIGDFAFVIWDGRKQQLFCARDPMGVRPFYYYHANQTFVFGSEIKSLFGLSEVPRELNEVRIADYVVPLLEDKTVTFYRDIYRLPPAHSLSITHGTAQLSTYWTLDPSYELHLGSDEAYAEAFNEIFTEAVDCRLRSAYPVGSMLSGGLDSSSIVCKARKLLAKSTKGPLHTFSAIFPSLPEDDLQKIDERPYMNIVVAMGGLEPHYVRADQISPFKNLAEVFKYQDEAIFSPQLFMASAMYQAASQQKIRILLDGFGGDSTVSHGTAYLTELVYKGQWETFAEEISALAESHRISPWVYLRGYGLAHLTELARRGKWATFVRETNKVAKQFDISRSNLLLNYGLKRLVPEFVRHPSRVLGHRRSFVNRISPIINSDFAHRIGVEDRYHILSRNGLASPKTLREDHYQELTSAVISIALAEANIAATAVSIEPRFPFFDKRLLEFCLSLPPEQKLHQGWGRIILRRAMAETLPVEVQWRTSKGDLSANFTNGMLNSDRKFIDHIILNDSINIGKYVDLPAVRELYEDYVAGNGSDVGIVIWRAVVLSQWLRQTELIS